MPATAEIAELLRALDCGSDAHLAWSRDATLALVRDTRSPFSRAQFAPGHLTASAIVLAPQRDALLVVFHGRLQRWLQPGGHFEPRDAGALAAALREVDEETGVALDLGVAPILCGVDVHEIPAARGEPVHLHHDLLFRLMARDRAVRVSAESARVDWAPLGALTDYGLDAPLLRNVERALLA